MEISLRLSASSQNDFIPSKSKFKNFPLTKKKVLSQFIVFFKKIYDISNLDIRSKLFYYFRLYITQNVSETHTCHTMKLKIFHYKLLTHIIFVRTHPEELLYRSVSLKSFHYTSKLMNFFRSA